MNKVQEGWVHKVLGDRKQGCLVTDYGMKYYWPGTKVTKSGYITNTTQIFNAPIQGAATAEVVPMGLVFLWHRLKGSNVILNMTTHDSVGGEVAPDVDEDWLREQVVKAFTTDVFSYMEECYNYTMTVPLSVGIKIGERCGSGKEHTGTVSPSDPEKVTWKVKGG